MNDDDQITIGRATCIATNNKGLLVRVDAGIPRQADLDELVGKKFDFGVMADNDIPPLKGRIAAWWADLDGLVYLQVNDRKREQ